LEQLLVFLLFVVVSSSVVNVIFWLYVLCRQVYLRIRVNDSVPLEELFPLKSLLM
jgi:hypothetical protein